MLIARPTFRAVALQVLLASTLAACDAPAAGAEDKGAGAPPQSPPTAAGTAAAATPSAKVVAAYLAVHKALSTDALPAARNAFASVESAAQAKAAIASEAVRARITVSAKQGASAKDIAAARKAFGQLSQDVMEWLRNEPNPASATLHLASCPMALDTGAKWLQLSDKIENPYFGSAMFTCGSVDAAISPGSKLEKP